MRFPHSCKLATASLGMCVILGLAAMGCGTSTPTSPTPAGSIGARGITDVAGTASFASLSTSSRGMAAAIVEWECFAAASTGSCPPARVSGLGVATGEVVTTPPGNLTRTVQGTTVVLSWGAPPGSQPTSYVIEAGSTSGASNITVFDTGSAATGLTVNNVPPGTYFVRVRGRDAAGTGPASSEVTVVVGGSAPPAASCQPRNLTAVVVGSDIAIGWEEPSGSGSQCGRNSYLIQAGSSPGASNVGQVPTPGLIPSYTVSGVPPGTYYIRVRAQGPGGLSGPSNEAIVTVSGISPPGTTTWVGESTTGNDDDCGVMTVDGSATFVQSGTTVTGIFRINIRSVSNIQCQPLVGYGLGDPFTGTVTGSFPNGAGTISFVTPSGGSFTGTYGNGRMTGTLIDSGDDASTIVLIRQ